MKMTRRAFCGIAVAGLVLGRAVAVSMATSHRALYRVTHHDDGGIGSLRAALEAEGPRTVVFDVGGQFELLDEVVVRSGDVYIDAASAPTRVTLPAGRILLDCSSVTLDHVGLLREPAPAESVKACFFCPRSI